MAYFDATLAFDAALNEIDLLISRAEIAQHKSDEYAVYTKAALVLLASKLEAFAENIVEDYADSVGELDLKAKHIPREVRATATSFLLGSCLNGGTGFNGSAKAVNALIDAAKLWDDEAPLVDLPIDTRFNYGKHGSKELRNLFERIGITDICGTCLVSSGIDSLVQQGGERENISADIDSLTNIRNNIIHSDASPANLTHQQIRKYRERLWEFCYLVDNHMEKTRYEIVSQSRSAD